MPEYKQKIRFTCTFTIQAKNTNEANRKLEDLISEVEMWNATAASTTLRIQKWRRTMTDTPERLLSLLKALDATVPEEEEGTVYLTLYADTSWSMTLRMWFRLANQC